MGGNKDQNGTANAWFKTHFRGSVAEEHLLMVNVSNPVIQAKINPGTLRLLTVITEWSGLTVMVMN